VTLKLSKCPQIITVTTPNAVVAEKKCEKKLVQGC